eukprot:197497-Rhodomonas_salina.3
MALPVLHTRAGTEIAYGATRRALWCYGVYGTEIGSGAMRCTLLRSAMVLQEIAHGATWRSSSTKSQVPIALRACYAMSGTGSAYGATLCSRMVLCDVRYWHSVRCCHLRTRLLRHVRAETAYAATTDNFTMYLDGAAAWSGMPICLRACYAMSATDKVYGPVFLRACCAMSGTNVAYCPICLRACAGTAINLSTRYAMSGTDGAYSATALLNFEPAMRCPVLSQRMMLLPGYYGRAVATADCAGPARHTK